MNSPYLIQITIVQAVPHSNVGTDCLSPRGIGVYFNNRLRRNQGSEGEARWLRWEELGGQQESTYLIGPRHRVCRRHKLGIWPKFLVGIGNITTEGYPGRNTFKGSLFVYAPGTSLYYILNRRLSIRGDYELLKWPVLSASPPHDNGLSLNGFNFGVAYTVIDR